MRHAETLHYFTYESSIGPLTLVASDSGLVELAFGRKKRANCVEDPKRLAKYRKQLDEYFAGKREEFTLPLDIRGTDFQKRCWQQLLKIPYGQTRSYRQIAEAVGNRNAVRAVGLANGQNPIAIIVPCHRVIASDGTLCGYGGGLNLKEELLRLEGARLF